MSERDERYDVFWLSGNDELPEPVAIEWLAKVRSASEFRAVAEQHAAEEPVGGLYRMVSRAGVVLAEHPCQDHGAQVLPLPQLQSQSQSRSAEPDMYAEEEEAYSRAG